MIRRIVFDLDNTLAPLGKPVAPKNVEVLRSLEDRGVMIAVCSGKPTYYLCGFLRQMGLQSPILIGENGAVIQFGVDLPPEHFYTLPYPQNTTDVLSEMKTALEMLVPGLWYQPNQVALTPFPKTEEEFDRIESWIAEHENLLSCVDIYRHIDSFDILPKGIDKQAGLRFLDELLGTDPRETAAVGDGINDYPMFQYAGLSVGIRLKEPDAADKNFETIEDALRWLQGYIFEE